MHPLHIRYRPKSFDEVIGNEGVVESLIGLFSRKDGVPHSFLFTGPSGCGKTTLARVIGGEIDCDPAEFFEINSSEARGIDTIRDIINKCSFSPMYGKSKIYLLDECHKLTSDAQNALLKILEDTPSHVFFILCTTDPDKVIKTIKNRCHCFSVSTLQRAKILRLLKGVLQKENAEVDISVLQKICECCEGSPRQALVMLDQVMDIGDKEIALQTIIDLTINDVVITDVCKAVLEGKSWEYIANLLKGIDDDPEKVRYAVLTYMSKVLLNGGAGNMKALKTISIFRDTWMYSGKAAMIESFFYACQKE